jgi:hypothetical protein
MRGFFTRLGLFIGGVLVYSFPIWGFVLAIYWSAPEWVIAGWVCGWIFWFVALVIASEDLGTGGSVDEVLLGWPLSPFGSVIFGGFLIGAVFWGLYEASRHMLRWLIHG